jgi:endonuclease G
MDSRQLFKEPALKEEFLDRFAELKAAAPTPGGGLESLEGGGYDLDQARGVAESMAEGSYDPGAEPGLEAIIERFTRPVYLVQDSTFVVPPDVFPNSDVIADQLKRARTALEGVIPSTGRIDLRNHRHDWVGTGWIVDSDIVVTNRHVAAEFAREDNGGFVFRQNFNGSTVAATVDWRHEYKRPDESRFRVTEVLWIEPEDSVDVGILRISPTGETGEPAPAPIGLMTRDEIDATLQGAWVAVIGYPASDSRNNAEDQQRIFDGHFNVKRLAPGQVTFFDGEFVLHHDATTLGGNSGSVVFDLDSGKAIGLHFGGIEGSRNEAVQAAQLREIIAQHAN